MGMTSAARSAGSPRLLNRMRWFGSVSVFPRGGLGDPLAAGALLSRLALVVCCGAGVYFATLWLVGFRLEDFRRRAAE